MDDDVLRLRVGFPDLQLLDDRAHAVHGCQLRPEALDVAEAIELVTEFVIGCAETRPHAAVADHGRIVATVEDDGRDATAGALRAFTGDFGPHHPLMVRVEPTIIERLRGRRTLRLYWPAKGGR
ncbi:hypothetical protein AB0J47_41860 [Nocardia sp. NPDC049737]|uniref:hypothetical protein n=1 Tax=Nocardia sp. NPDC049737 TaxID=3154358 RepID=UPI00341795AE